MNSKFYDFLKAFNMISLPAVTAIYITFGSTWQVAAGMATINVLLGIYLWFSSKRWHDSEDNYAGELALTANDPDTGIPGLQLTVTRDPNEFANQRTILFKSVDNR